MLRGQDPHPAHRPAGRRRDAVYRRAQQFLRLLADPLRVADRTVQLALETQAGRAGGTQPAADRARADDRRVAAEGPGLSHRLLRQVAPGYGLGGQAGGRGLGTEHRAARAGLQRGLCAADHQRSEQRRVRRLLRHRRVARHGAVHVHRKRPRDGAAHGGPGFPDDARPRAGRQDPPRAHGARVRRRGRAARAGPQVVRVHRTLRRRCAGGQAVFPVPAAGLAPHPDSADARLARQKRHQPLCGFRDADRRSGRSKSSRRWTGSN